MNIPIGSICSFRYKRPGDVNWAMPRTILVLNPEFNGQLHGLKITFLAAEQQEILQNVFMKMYSAGQNNTLYPLEQQIYKLRQELEILNKQANESMQASQRRVMTPSGMIGMVKQVGMVQSVKSAASSIFKKVSTFGRSQIEPQPPANQQQIQQQVQQNNDLLEKKNQELNKVLALYNQQKMVMDQIPIVPKDPFMFYHQFLKPYIGDNRIMKQVYRKFNVSYIVTPRIERLPRGST